MSGNGRLDGKVAIVTGAASGMGAAEARLFVDEGAHVVLTDLDDERGVALAETLGDRAEYRHHDVGDETHWAELVRHVDSTHGRVDVLVNNAGVARAGAIDEFSWDDFDLSVRVNQRGPLLGMRAVIEPMRRSGRGSIVNIASGAALQGERGLIVYSGTKFALRGMTQVAAAELASDGIRVNVVHPGCIDTPMHQQNPPEHQATLIGRIPLKRFGDPAEVATMVLFLASDESSYITGTDFAVDGGILL
ncbi:SDR family NAD(P)-dependent oxidoreductase [Aeromicrobium endophyticum]|uniref:SDR family NAD(P)-dependent oxidoreductase n=1 Tax=Aeromicrobium endophyticum TaxID=2292704 RepID=A0A371PCR3_9ACTN|nr:glucose 1-dehydrogenase [Aeromicrobium endophyticum]REK73697.1 SDR family NAD(P)-dependent oxidoreductase [Aeromicrobium endophyticum]